MPLVEGKIVPAGTQVLDEDPIELAGDEPVAYAGEQELEAVELLLSRLEGSAHCHTDGPAWQDAEGRSAGQGNMHGAFWS